MNARDLLLIDLDGVLVFERAGSDGAAAEILKLHQGLCERLDSVDGLKVVLTHRSRAEARRILHAVALDPARLDGVMAAEDLALAALRSGGWTSIPRYGLRKRLILPRLARRFDLPLARMALIDDRIENVEDMLDAGIGLGLLAPSALADDGRMTSFSLDQALAELRLWREGAGEKRLTPLLPVTDDVRDWQSTGLSTQTDSQHIFNKARSSFRQWRQKTSV